MSNYIKVYDSLCDLLKRQKEGGAMEQAVESTRRRIRSVYDAAIQNGDHPVKPDFDDEAFKGINWDTPKTEPVEPEVDDLADEPAISLRPREGESLNPDAENLPYIRTVAQSQARMEELSKQLESAKDQVIHIGKLFHTEKKRLRKMLEAEKTGRRFRSHRPIPLPPPPAPCFCGCGTMLPPRGNYEPARFASGHQVRYVNMIIDVERGGRKVRDLPPILRKNLQWVRCKECGRPIPTTDPAGRPIQEQIGLACWRRVRHIWWPYKCTRSRSR